MAIGDFPKIVWGSALQYTLTLGAPLDHAKSFKRLKPGSERIIAPSGVRDAWRTGIDWCLRGRVRRVPITTSTFPFLATGWDDANGWLAFFDWAWEGNSIFNWYPNKNTGTFQSAYLDEPWETVDPDEEDDGQSKQFDILIVSSDGTAFTGY